MVEYALTLSIRCLNLKKHL